MTQIWRKHFEKFEKSNEVCAPYPPWKYSGFATDGKSVEKYIDYWQYIKKTSLE